MNSKVAVLVAGVVLLLASTAAVAHAATPAPYTPVALQVGTEMGNGFSGAYGDEVELQPATMNSIERPGEKFHFQVYMSTLTSQGVPFGWTDFKDFEDIQLEDTNTVQPFTYNIGVDDGVILNDGLGTVAFPQSPYQIRCEYKALDSSGTANSTLAPSFSETETVTVEKNMSTTVGISTSGSVKHLGTNFNFQVSPDCGIGNIVVTVKKSGAKNRTYTLTTDETGAVSAKLKLGTKKGTYKVYAKFGGNAYGVASKTAVKTLKVSH
ncbi:MAG: hypothetical protein P4L93_01365 [Coriobacteriia bacterium]|nr:hypothetical protein [Coriobacteriia bacterium]